MFVAGPMMQVPMITQNPPVNMPHRRPKWSFRGPAKGRAEIQPMLYMAKTRPVPELADFLYGSDKNVSFYRSKMRIQGQDKDGEQIEVFKILGNSIDSTHKGTVVSLKYNAEVSNGENGVQPKHLLATSAGTDILKLFGDLHNLGFCFAARQVSGLDMVIFVIVCLVRHLEEYGGEPEQSLLLVMDGTKQSAMLSC